MEHILLITAIFSVFVVTSHATLSPEEYWKLALPKTVMPKTVKDLLSPEWTEEKSTSVSVGKGGVNVNTGKSGGTSVNVGHGNVGVHTGKGSTNVGIGKGGVDVNTGKGTNVNVGHDNVGVHTKKGTNVNVGHRNVGVHTGKGTNVGVGKGGVGVHTGKGTNVGVGKGGVSVNTGHKGKPVHVNVKPGPNPFDYQYAATETQLHDGANGRGVFFLEKDLRVGNTMNLLFSKTDGDAAFLPRSDAEKIPFSSQKMPDILTRYNVKVGSEEGQMMATTVKECEKPGIRGEEKYCATSLESMIDFTTSHLGKNVQAITTKVGKEETQWQKYTITGVNKAKGNEAVVCHKKPYPYAVFLCHHFSTAKSYTVSLTGADNTKINAAAVCHTDTSAWNPKHLAFQVLKVQPGTVPVCHYIPEGHLVWVAK